MEADPCRLSAILIFFCVIHVALSALTKTPKNAIIEKGDDVYMECSTNLTGTNPISWKYDNIDITREPCESLFPERFLVSSSTTPNCFIVGLGNSTSGNQGPYVCSDGDVSAEAIVILIDPKPECRVEGVPIRGQNVTLSCSMSYTRFSDEARLNPGTSVSASISWESAAGTFLSSSSTAVTVGAVSVGEAMQVDVTTLASGIVIPSYNCTSWFQFAEMSSGSTFALNNVSWTCVSAPVLVWYCPENVTIGPTYGNYTAGDILTCMSDGYPEPSYQWTDSDGVVVSTSSTTMLGEGPFNLTCTATGNFTTPCNASATVSGNATGTLTTTTMTTTTVATTVSVGTGTTVPNTATTVSGATEGTGTRLAQTGSTETGATPTDGTGTGDAGLNTTLLALAVGLSAAGLLLLGVILAVVLIRRRRKKDTEEVMDEGRPGKSRAFFQAVRASPPSTLARNAKRSRAWATRAGSLRGGFDNHIYGHYNAGEFYDPRDVGRNKAFYQWASIDGLSPSMSGRQDPAFTTQSYPIN